MTTTTVLLALFAFLQTAFSQSTIVDKVIEKTTEIPPELVTLLAAVSGAGLATTLSDTTKNYTVFAPTDVAFADLPNGTLASLLADVPSLQNVLLYHVVEGRVLSTDLSDGLVVTTESCDDIEFEINSGVFIKDSTTELAQVTQADILADNGVIHIINKVLLPPDDDSDSTDSDSTDTGSDDDSDDNDSDDDDSDSAVNKLVPFITLLFTTLALILLV